MFIAAVFVVWWFVDRHRLLKLKLDYMKPLDESLFWCIWQESSSVFLSKSLQKKLALPQVTNLNQICQKIWPEYHHTYLNAIENSHTQCFLWENKTYELRSFQKDHLNILLLISLESASQEISKKSSKIEKFNDLLLEILDSAPIAFWHRDSNGKIVWGNEFYKCLLADQQVIEKNDLGKKNVYSILQGTKRLLEVNEMGAKDGSIGYALDITNYDELDRFLKDHLKTQNDILHQLSAAIAVFDQNARLKFYNKAFLILFNFDEGFLSKFPNLSDILDDLRNRQKIPEPENFLEYKNQQKKLFTDLMSPLEQTMHLPNGKILRHVVTPQSSGGLLYIYEDITQNLHLEQEKKTLSAVQKEIFDHLNDGIMIFGSDHCLSICNQAIDNLLNIVMHSGQHLNVFVESTARLFNTSPKEWEMTLLSLFEKRIKHEEKIKLASEKDVNWMYIPLPNGAHLLYFANKVISALPKDHLLSLSERVFNDFISINNNIHENCTKILNYHTEDEIESHVQNIALQNFDLRNNGINLYDTIQLKLGKLKPHLEKINVHEYMKQILKPLQVYAAFKKIHLKYFKDEGMEYIISDKMHLKQIVENILLHLLKRTPENGTVSFLIDKSNKFSFISEDALATIATQEINFDLSIAKELLMLQDSQLLISKSGQRIHFVLKESFVEKIVSFLQ